MYKYTLLIMSLFLGFSGTSQNNTWITKMMSGEHTYKEIQEQFNSDWQDIEYTRGHGWKQFKRWEHFWNTRLMPDGSFPNYGNGFTSFNNYIKSNEESTSRNGSWTPIGPTNYSVTSSWSPGLGRVNFIVEDPNDPSIIYLGTPGGGAWKSTNSGNSWIPLSDNLAAIGISSIGIAKTNSQIIYMATGDSDGADTPSIGIAKSTDGGSSWTIVGDSDDVPGQLADILVDPTNSEIVYVASKNEGIFKTTNGGSSWSRLISGTYRDIEFKPGNSQVLIAAGSSDIQVSTNAGLNWTAATGIPTDMTRIALGVTPADDSYVYALIADEEGKYKGVYLSTDSGISFTPRNTTTDCFEGDQSWFDMAIGVSSTDKDLIFTGVLNVWKSTDGGNTLIQVNAWDDFNSPTYTHADIHFVRYYGGNLYCGTDGGIYKSTNDGSSFSDLSDGLQIGQFYRISGIENNVNTLAGGLQDNGNYIKSDSGWKVWLGADGMENAVNPNNPMEAYGMTQNGGLNKTSDGGITFEDVADYYLDLQGEWVTPMDYDATTNRIVAGYDKIYQYNGTWTQLSTFNFDANLNCLEIAPSNTQIIYASVLDKIYRTSDNGTTVEDITNNLSNINSEENSITSIEVQNTDPSKVWVTFGGWTNGVKLAYSSDNGATWSNISGTLPNIPCNIVKVDASSSETNGIYIGMDIGMYYMDDSESNFIPFMNNLPKVKVLDIEINETNDVIRAGTYGRGIWESPTFEASMTSTDNVYTNSTSLAQVYPNPVINELNIEVKKSNFEFYITNINGKVVHQGKAHDSIKVNLTQNSSGIYFITVFANGKKQTIKLLKK